MQRLLAHAARLCASASHQQLRSGVASVSDTPAWTSLCRIQHRWASDDASPGDQLADADALPSAPEAAAGLGSGAADAGEAGSAAEEEVDVDDYQLTAAGQDAMAKEDWTWTERPRRRPTREEKGSYIDNADFENELDDIAIPMPEGRPLYDLKEAAPGLVQPTSEALDQLLSYGQEHLDELFAGMGVGDMEDDTHAGLRPILRWEVRMRLDTSGLSNPVNRKAVCRVYLRELQEETGLTDDALQHIALVCGKRYNPNKGELTLISEQYAEREDNRLHIAETLRALVEEGERVYPSVQPEQEAHAASA